MTTINRLKKYNDRPLTFNGTLKRKPILISDSKGNCLKPHSDLLSQFRYNIDFQCRGGIRFQEQYYWLLSNLKNKIRQYGNIVVYVWLGTCDLTLKISEDVLVSVPGNSYNNFRKRKTNFIELRHKTDREAVSYLQFQIDRIVSFVSGFPTVKLVFLEIPPYSIEEWNLSKGHRDPTSFHSQDLKLAERISLVNEYISYVNEKVSVKSPRFKADLLKFRKSKKGDVKRVSLSFSAYKDGVHPGPVLARCWMRKLVTQILVDCV